MRALSGTKEPEQIADAIIHQPSVRTMLLNTRETEQMIDRAYRYCLSNHLPTTVAQRHLDIYSLIIPTQTQ